MKNGWLLKLKGSKTLSHSLIYFFHCLFLSLSCFCSGSLSLEESTVGLNNITQTNNFSYFKVILSTSFIVSHLDVSANVYTPFRTPVHHWSSEHGRKGIFGAHNARLRSFNSREPPQKSPYRAISLRRAGSWSSSVGPFFSANTLCLPEIRYGTRTE